MESLTFDELDQAPRYVHGGARVGNALRSAGLLAVEPSGLDSWRVTPTGKVGAAIVDGFHVVVTPKERVPIARLLFLLGYAADPGFLDHWSLGEQEPDLLSIIAESLARHSEVALALGPIQGYETMNEDLTTVKGRIDLATQIAQRQGRSYPIAVTYDDYTLNTPENRILLTALRRALRLPRLTSDTHARLRHSTGKLAGAEALRAGAPLPRWRPSRLNQRYVPALRFAEMLLRSDSPEAGTSGTPIAAFAVDMAKVFEDFLTVAVREALRSSGARCEGQREIHLDFARHVAMKPDLTLLRGAEVVGVVDAKYKLLRGETAHNADIYQMLAYCTALHLPEAWLVHASAIRGGGRGASTVIAEAGVTVHHWNLDLRRTPDDILADVAAFVAAATASGAGQLAA